MRSGFAAILVLLSATACGHADGSPGGNVDERSVDGDETLAPPASSSSEDGGHEVSDTGMQDDPNDAMDGGIAADGGEPTLPTPDGGSESQGGHSGLQPSLGPCCQPNDTPGCQNQAVTACVCDRIPECCTEAWSEACALMVQQKHCEPGVRECVCGAEEGQWQLQDTCCTGSWSNLCQSTAVQKCGAAATCF